MNEDWGTGAELDKETFSAAVGRLRAARTTEADVATAGRVDGGLVGDPAEIRTPARIAVTAGRAEVAHVEVAGGPAAVGAVRGQSTADQAGAADGAASLVDGAASLADGAASVADGAASPAGDPASLADDLRRRLTDRRAATAAARNAAAAYAALHGHVPGGSDDELERTGGRRWALRPRTALVAVCAVLLLAVAGAVVTAWPRGHVEELAAVESSAASGEVPAPSPGPAPTPSPSPSALVVVDVVGQVHNPGVVTLPAGSRVFDAVAAAGGATEGAELSGVNLARPVVDGEQVRVPAPGEVVAAPAAPEGVTAGDGLVNLNSADEAALDTLPGIGPALAARIVEWRTTNGPFASVDELDEVSGIGPALLAKVRDLVTV